MIDGDGSDIDTPFVPEKFEIAGFDLCGWKQTRFVGALSRRSRSSSRSAN